MTSKKHVLILAGVALTMAAALITHFGFLEPLEVKVADFLQTARPSTDDMYDKLTVVGISDFAIEQQGQWPWPRRLQAKLVDEIARRGAKVIGMDILFKEPADDPADDGALADALRRAGNVFLAAEIKANPQSGDHATHFPVPFTLERPVSQLAQAARGIGFVNIDYVFDNVDGIVRKAPLAEHDETGAYLPSLSLALVSTFQDTRPVFLPDGGIRFPSRAYTVPTFPSRFRIRVDQPHELPRYDRSAYINYDRNWNAGALTQVDASDVLTHDAAIADVDFAGRIVFIGSTMSAVDLKLTPFGSMAGVFVQAHLVRNLLEQAFLRRISPVGVAAVIALTGVVSTVIALSCSVVPAIALTFVGLVLYAGLAYVAYMRDMYLLDVVPVVVLAIAVVLLLHLLQATLSLRRRMRNLQSLYELGRVFNAVLNLSELAERVLHTYIELTDAQGAVLMTQVEGGDSMEIEQVGTLPDWLIVSLGRKKNQRGIIDDLGAHPRITTIEGVETIEFERFGVERVVFLPLVYHEGATGWICLSGQNLSSALLDSEERDYWLALSSIVRTALENARLYKLATVDGLTTLYVRHFFDIAIDREFSRARRHKAPMAMLITDVDKFKNFNDTYGHQMGDRVLRVVAGECKASVRNVDIPARYGGEEFAIILPDTNVEGAKIIAERIRSRIDELRIEHQGQTIHITISIGVATTESTQARTVKQFIEEADKSLYRAKETGRNRVCFYSPVHDDGITAAAAPPAAEGEDVATEGVDHGQSQRNRRTSP